MLPLPAPFRGWAVVVPAALLTGCSAGSGAERARPPAEFPTASAVPSGSPTTAGPALSSSPRNPWGSFSGVDVVSDDLNVPWGLAFLPDGTALVSERESGRVLALRPGKQPERIARLPVDALGEGGLLGIAVAPSYARDRFVYAYYTGDHDNRIVRLRAGAEPAVLVDGIAKNSFHNGGRIAFGPDGMLYAGTGDAGDRTRAQDRASLNGKILRMRPDGSVPPDNPFPGSLVWSLGHRNVQGLAWDAQGRLYATEFGQDRFDEVNLIRKGGNYGWPEVEGVGGQRRYVDPVLTWQPAEASPSGATFAGGDLFVATLRGERLWQVRLGTGGDSPSARSLLAGKYGRLRHVATGPDGALWLLTSNRDGRGHPRQRDDEVLRIPVP